MTEASGQVAVIQSRIRHPHWPNHVIVTAQAVTLCEAREGGFSGTTHLLLLPGDRVTFTVAHDVTFPAHGEGQVDGQYLATYALSGNPVIQSCPH